MLTIVNPLPCVRVSGSSSIDMMQVHGEVVVAVA